MRFKRVTPRTAQLVVMRGKYTPSAWYKVGVALSMTISTNCTRTAMTKIKEMVRR